MRIIVIAALTAVAAAAAGCSTTQRDRASVVTPPKCVDETVQIYFERLSAEVTPEGRSVINAAAASLKSCKIRAVEVLGLADAVGDPLANLQLSQRRALSVSSVLASAGLPAAEFKLAAAGEEGAKTGDGKNAPLRRRVDVTLRVAP